MNTVNDLTDTIAPKSDQLNADDLLTGPLTVDIIAVTRGSKDQPVAISIKGKMPYRPCKSMIRVLITAWGQDGKAWAGKRMTLYCDPSVKFGGVALGGIRISHLSHIDGPMNMMLTQSRGRKAQVVVKPLQAEVDYSEIILKYMNTPDGDDKNKLWAILTPDQQIAINETFAS